MCISGDGQLDTPDCPLLNECLLPLDRERELTRVLTTNSCNQGMQCLATMKVESKFKMKEMAIMYHKTLRTLYSENKARNCIVYLEHNAVECKSTQN